MRLPKQGCARLLTVVALAALAAVTAATALAQGLVTDFSAGQGNGRYAFASWTPKTLGELFNGKGQSEGVNVVGHLFLPAGAEKAPAVLLMHGSGGIYRAMLEFWPQQFNAAGYAVLSVDSFGPRGVKSTAEDQSQVPFTADVADAFAALQLLASHPRIDATRIAIMGFSRGGITTWRAGIERVIAAQKLPDGLRFAAHLPVYSGGCVGPFRLIVKPGVFSKAPMLWIHGDADDYAGMAPCRDYAERIGKAGTPVEFTVIEGARHKFDSDDPKRYHLSGVQRTLDACPVEIDIDTLAAYDRFTGQRLSREVYEATLKNSCRALGASVEGNRGAREKAARSALGFLRKVFAR